MKQGEHSIATGPSVGHRGFFYIVRGHVHRVCKVDLTDPALELLEGVTSPEALVQDILGPGMTIGMQEANLCIGDQGEYITSSFCHLCFFDSGHLGALVMVGGRTLLRLAYVSRRIASPARV